MKDDQQWVDPIVTEVRRVRDQLAKRFHYDVKAICADLMKRQGATVTIVELGAGQYSQPKARPALARETPLRKRAPR